MKGTISARDRRTLVVGASVVVPLFFIGRVLPAAVNWERTRASEAQNVLREAEEALEIVRSVPAMRDSLVARSARLAVLDSQILSGPSPAAAAAALASTLSTLADSAPLKVTSMQLRADTASRSSLVMVGVRLNGLADVAGLAAFLRAVEGGNTLLVIRELSVGQPDPGAADNKPEVLRIEVLVEGLTRVSTEKRS